MLQFDEDELARVAAVVIRFNRHAKAWSVAEMVADMKRCAAESSIETDLGYVATRGYVLTAYRMGGDDRSPVGVKASVADHLFTEE